jgi:hypothetical protein
VSRTLATSLRGLAILIHAPNESVGLTEIEHMALTEAVFLREYARRMSG